MFASLEAMFIDRGNAAELTYRLATNGAWYTGRSQQNGDSVTMSSGDSMAPLPMRSIPAAWRQRVRGSSRTVSKSAGWAF